jgi:hypothetical protein
VSLKLVGHCDCKKKDVHGLQEKVSCILLIILFKLKLNTKLNVEMYMARAAQLYKIVGEVKTKAKALRHFKVKVF